MKKLYFLLIIQLIGAVWAPICFKYLEPKNFAALIAGSGFIAVSLINMFGFYRIKMANTWMLINAASWCVFLIIFALPQVYLRLSYWELYSINHLQIYGIPFWQFHKLASAAYVTLLGLMLSTIIYCYLKKIHTRLK